MALPTVVLPSLAHADGEVLRFNTMYDPPMSTADQTGFLDRVTKEVFNRLDHKAEVVTVQPKVSLRRALKGTDDGMVLRRDGFGDKYPEIVQVDEKVLTYSFVTFTRDQAFRPDGWHSLKRFRIGIIRGWNWPIKNLHPEQTVVWANNADHLFKLLDQGVIQMAVYERHQGAEITQRLKLDGIRPAEPALHGVDSFLYLHERHKGLAPKAAKALAEMKADGTFARIAGETLGPGQNF